MQGKRYYKKHKDEINERNKLYARNGGNLKKYGITLNDYNYFLKTQGDVCVICKEKETSKLKGVIKNLAVDHCHKTGKVRGLLCDKCNRGLGYFRDNKMFIKNALRYLEKHEN